jgi:hypothetical protein
MTPGRQSDGLSRLASEVDGAEGEGSHTERPSLHGSVGFFPDITDSGEERSKNI